MDPLTASIVNLQQASLSSKVDFAVARKILDSQSQDGRAVMQLLNAADQGINQSGDALVAAATGLGGQIDTYA